MDTLVTVVIPVYNVEKYLARCVDSILCQTYDRLQIILVDDGSPDNCGTICDQYASLDERIQVIHKINGGLSDARNSGIAAAEGEWISFVDSDDCVSTVFIETMLETAKKSECDIVQCEYQRFSDGVIPSVGITDESFTIISSIEHLKNIDVSVNVAACNKLYRRTLFENIRYPEGRIHEDVATTFKLVYEAKKICLISTPLYYYFINPNSITTSVIKNNKLDLIDAYYDQVVFFSTTDCNKLVSYSANKLLACFGSLLSFPKDRYLDYNEFKEKLQAKYIELRPFLMKIEVRKDLKFIMMFSLSSLTIFKIVHKIKKVLRREAHK